MATLDTKNNNGGRNGGIEKGAGPKRPQACAMLLLALFMYSARDFYWYTHSPVVTTNNGPVKGLVSHTFSGNSFYAFKGIPFAAPPVGSLRFKDPVPPRPWTEVLNTNKVAPMCPQPQIRVPLVPEKIPSVGEIFRTFQAIPRVLSKLVHLHTQSEDCLYLNVYVPKPKDDLESSELPSNLAVLFFVHGGAFLVGTSSDSDLGPEYLMATGDVVVVTTSYRLGALGYLNLGVADAPSNVGLKDVALALQWVHDNIARFGGDPTRVTVAGQSAGSATAHYMSLAPSTKGLFHRLLLMSGNALMGWAHRPAAEARRRSVAFAARLGCTGTAAAIVECLRKKEVHEFTNEEKLASAEERDWLTEFPFVPTVDGSLIPAPPLELVSRGAFHHVPTMVGVTSREGYIAVMSARQRQRPVEEEARIVSDHFRSLLPNNFRELLPEKSANLRAMELAVKDFYFEGGSFVSKPLPDHFLKMFGDIMFTFDTYRLLRKMSVTAKSPVYVYNFTMDGRLNNFKRVFQMKLPGACHGDEMGYLFNWSFLPAEPLQETDPETRVRNAMVTMWTNFVRVGNPTPNVTSVVEKLWPAMSDGAMPAMNIGQKLALQDGLDPHAMHFWDRVYMDATSPTEPGQRT